MHIMAAYNTADLDGLVMEHSPFIGHPAERRRRITRAGIDPAESDARIAARVDPSVLYRYSCACQMVSFPLSTLFQWIRPASRPLVRRSLPRWSGLAAGAASTEIVRPRRPGSWYVYRP
jgi:hypothetical protein